MPGKPKTPIKIIGERDIELHLSNENHHEQIVKIGKAYPTEYFESFEKYYSVPPGDREHPSPACLFHRPAYQDLGGGPAYCHRDPARTPRLHEGLYLQHAVIPSGDL